MTKERLDNILVEKQLFENRSKAQAAIIAGSVKVNGETITKPAQKIELKEETNIEIKTLPYVSRGGFKLEKAIKEFNINLKGKTCLDAGASTGGFTDCMLQNGAKKVFAVDVGYGQLAWPLRQNPSVKTIERTNIKNCAFEEIYAEDEEPASFCTMDLSFISIKKVLPNIKTLLTPQNQEVIALIKPQFEAGKELVGKNGVVKDPETHKDIIKDIIEFAKTLDLNTQNLTFSPIKGPKGNIEYLIHLTNSKNELQSKAIEQIVETAFFEL